MPSVSILASEEDELREPFYPMFNAVVEMMTALLLPNGYDVVDDASLCDSLYKIKTHYHKTGRIMVWSGGSENTIYGVPAINHAFRAWHDLMHIQYDFPFSTDGENMVCLLQQRQVMAACETDYNKTDITLFCRILECEINGQVEYLNIKGQFPEDQRAFHRLWMKEHQNN